ncbi:MAG: type II toxin-antitoxin system RelE/ParE family toxin [Thiohalospira sp.]
MRHTGNWRIIYEIHDQQLLVQVIRLGSRGEIYK